MRQAKREEARSKKRSEWAYPMMPIATARESKRLRPVRVYVENVEEGEQRR